MPWRSDLEAINRVTDRPAASTMPAVVFACFNSPLSGFAEKHHLAFSVPLSCTFELFATVPAVLLVCSLP